ncbi:MAG: FAD-binding oxidoreductase [Planctomycetes bacterium]|nr:FAD-binding oxidoreductase [Planctomycetota bacterium]MCC7170691.1 FAD-binding oxidoreductase [Planctomycetota bacterium]
MNGDGTSSRATDVLVVGAGIVGVACAAAFAARGATVRVIERGPIGGGATAAGMGHLMVLDDAPAEFALTRRSCELWTELAPDLPPRAEYSVAGTLWVATDSAEFDVARAKFVRLREVGIDADLLDESALREVEPALRPGLLGGLRLPTEAIVYPPVVARWLLDRAGILGRPSMLFARVARIEPGRVTLDDGTVLAAGIIVNAAGVDGGTLTPGIVLRARKGHLMITDRYPGQLRHEVVELGYIKNAHGAALESVACNVQPRATGQWLVGSSRQFDVVDPRAEPRMLARVAARAIEFLPCLAHMNVVRAWTGLRAVSVDGLPIIGEHPTQRGVWLALGHEGLGITTALATAELLVDLVERREPRVPAAAFDPARCVVARAS